MKRFQLLLLVVFASLFVLAALACESTDQPRSTAKPNAEQTAAAAAEEAEDRRKGFHCLSPWDGNHDGLEALIRDELNDPGSMETIETRITPVDEDGNHTYGIWSRQ